MCEYFCIGFIGFITNSFSPIEYEQNDKILLKYFQ